MSTPPAGKPYSQAEIEAAVKILREDAILTHNRAIAGKIEAIEERLGRMPVAEMTAEEKAAEYDRLMAEKAGKAPAAAPPAGAPGSAAPGAQEGAGPGGPGTPPPPPPKGDTKPSATERTVPRSWWDAYQKDSAS